MVGLAVLDSSLSSLIEIPSPLPLGSLVPLLLAVNFDLPFPLPSANLAPSSALLESKLLSAPSSRRSIPPDILPDLSLVLLAGVP